MSAQPSPDSQFRCPFARLRPILRARDPARIGTAGRVVLKMLAGLRYGTLDLQLPDGSVRRFGIGNADGPRARMMLSNWNVCAAVLKSGDTGFAEAYLAGDWQTDDLRALLDLMVGNRASIEKAVYGSWPGRLMQRLRHLRHANTKAGSRRNIQAHYDLGNAFYALWLDETMTYSSALFDSERSQTLVDAQRAKYRRLLAELRIDGDATRVLEIGCGWGGFAELAARESNAHVTGVTLSKEQLAHGRARIAQGGLSERVELRLQDYRDLRGQFDAIASIEMFEAVGEQYWPSYFECLARNLKRGGRACVQTITIDDALFERYRKSSDFIQQYVFPGGMLPSPSVFAECARKHGLKVVNRLSFGFDYARTLTLWRDAFLLKLDAVREQQFDERFIRLWDFYLCYCAAAFDHANTDVIQFTLEHA